MGIGVGGGSRRSQQFQRKEQRKIITSMSLSDDVQLNKAEKAWKPSTKKAVRSRAEESEENDPEQVKTQELFKRVRSILNKLTPQKFQQLMKQVTELTIDTEERLKGVIDLTFEKAISEPDFSVAYANMCRCVMGVSGATQRSIVCQYDVLNDINLHDDVLKSKDYFVVKVKDETLPFKM